MTDLLYRPGLEGIIAGETSISTIDGGLLYRGYPVEELCDHTTFDEVAYLILHGQLPNVSQLADFNDRLRDAATLPAPIAAAIKSIPDSVPFMDVMRTGASMLAHWDPEVGNDSHEANLRKSERLLAQLPLVMGARFRTKHGDDILPPNPDVSFAANVLYLVTGDVPSAAHVKAMDVSLILYAEHEFNASAFASRVVCSTLSDLHSSITAAIGALKGPLHGGANERVMEVLQEVGSPDRAESWVRDALANKVKIMGFGHRVYKTGDPRAKYLKQFCAQLAQATGNEAMESMADTIESVVTGEKGLPPNLDWPSARLYYYMGLPVELYTPLFVLSRVTGWSAHVIEQLDNNRIIRPRSSYTGEPKREVTPASQRA